MTELKMAMLAVNHGAVYFRQLVAAGFVTLDALHIRIGIRDMNRLDGWRELHQAYLDGDETSAKAEGFDVNTVGKASTCAAYGMDSDRAKRAYGDAIPDGPQSWTGGVCYKAEVEIGDETRSIEIIVAASGVQGFFDRAVSYTVALTYAAMWTSQQEELAGLRV